MSETVLPQAQIEPPDMEIMPRADVPALWVGFKQRLEFLKKTAETLTVTDLGQVAEMRLARETRLILKNLRIDIENKRKELGEEALRRTQRINAAARELRELIEPLEARLLEQETFVEREQKRLQQACYTRRFEELRPFLTPGLDNSVGLGLSNLTEENYQKFLADTKAVHEARLERERKEKEDAEKEQKRKEAAEAERRQEAEKERERLQKELAAIQEKNREEKAAREAAEALAAQERERREAIEAEQDKAQRAAEAAEKKAADEEKARLRKIARASDKIKLDAFARAVDALVVPDLKDKEMSEAIHAQCAKFAKWVRGLHAS